MDASTHSKARLGLEKQEHLVKLAILTIAAILCESKKWTFWMYSMISMLRLYNPRNKLSRDKEKINELPLIMHKFCVVFSICNSTLFGSTIWECYSWVRSVFQLSHNALLNWTGFLQFPQLVRWSGLVRLLSTVCNECWL